MEALSADDTSERRSGSTRSDDRPGENPELTRRMCSKMRCVQIATSTFRFDYKISKVWLSSMPTDPEEAGYVLCEMHAEQFTVPIGWTVDDTREPQVDLRAERERGHGRRREAIDADHPAVQARAKHLEIRPAQPTADVSADTHAPLDEHPSGPLDLESRAEPPEVTREINRLARHLALDADTDPGAGVPSDLFPSNLDYGIDVADDGTDTAPPEAPYVPEPSRSTPPELPTPTAENDDDSTFGDDIVGEERTEQISLDDLEEAARVYLDDDRRRHDPPGAD